MLINEKTPIGEFIKMKYGKMPPADILSDEGYPIFSGYRITGYAKEFLYEEPMLVLVARGVGGTGDIKISPPNSWITNLSIILEVDKEKADKKFLFYKLSSEPLKDNLNTGAAQAQITVDVFSKYKIYLPTLETQKRIAEILSAYDDLIENNLKRIKLLEESARLLYREWFVRLKFSNYEHTRIIDGLPEGWVRLAVPEFIDINPKTTVNRDKENCFVEMASLSNDSMVISYFERKFGNSGSKFQNGDTLFARITPCLENGKTGFVNFLENGETAFGSTEFIVLRAKTVPPEFVYCLSRTYNFRENAIKNMVGSSGRQRVKTSCFNEFFVAIPPKRILDEFEFMTRPCFHQIRNLQLQNQKLKQARDLLLPRLISGEITV